MSMRPTTTAQIDPPQNRALRHLNTSERRDMNVLTFPSDREWGWALLPPPPPLLSPPVPTETDTPPSPDTAYGPLTLIISKRFE
ncbi:hypothetical protein BD769DRAFT_1660881 [Suillus cothurnatus]|nr:hypothetical protein BD769DRAFT_1660881 [Suillus cothurnatus]